MKNKVPFVEMLTTILIVTLLAILAALLFGCAPARWELKPGPEDTKLTTMERSGIIRFGELAGAPGGFGHQSWYYSWDERILFMEPPVKVLSTTTFSHGVFREKWKGFLLVVIDGNGEVFRLGETSLDVKPGTILKPVKR